MLNETKSNQFNHFQLFSTEKDPSDNTKFHQVLTAPWLCKFAEDITLIIVRDDLGYKSAHPGSLLWLSGIIRMQDTPVSASIRKQWTELAVKGYSEFPSLRFWPVLTSNKTVSLQNWLQNTLRLRQAHHPGYPHWQHRGLNRKFLEVSKSCPSHHQN